MRKSSVDAGIIVIGLMIFLPLLAVFLALSIRESKPLNPHECDQFFRDSYANDKCRTLRGEGIPIDTILVMYRERVK